jgi:hypothetical protein
MNNHLSWPLDHQEHVVDALIEQETTAEEIDELLPTLLRLTEWQAPTPTVLDTQHLLTKLEPLLPAELSVRQAIHTRQQNQRGNLAWLLELAYTQVSILQFPFWLLSIGVTILGMLIGASGTSLDHGLLLRIIGPLLAYLGTVDVFRGREFRVLEIEMVCPPSLIQLTIARLSIVLGYDVGLGILLSLFFWFNGSTSFLTLTLSWLMPLLLVTSSALLLSTCISIQLSALITYGGWLALVALNLIRMQTGQETFFLFRTIPETITCFLSLALLIASSLFLQSTRIRWLPHS